MCVCVCDFSFKTAHEVPESAGASFTVVVKEQGAEEVRRAATSVSNPKSAKYGQYLTQEQLDDLTRPKAQDMQAVLTWLETNNMQYVVPTIQGKFQLLPPLRPHTTPFPEFYCGLS